ncbi:pyruvate dehydrogenase E2 component (dihydrolipoamide acetyltransferase) [Nonomuraea maritima]|uniref:Dihydrolipoamide acetyltransferase component of pyruvate dehydrogenase complex n=1 Tax=Nonomuraea maritima TaxID=683260 RepID=A0A1G9KHV2_9ACTN|nr:dihydrolipoamide acetyltransferase family protein [Nonomuraea maritima]SDL49209.1 pyruvate dehydrogenase E2 component (dihydrolipoamide acetyltransferase) [Nonomuraea maritima]
MRREFKLPDVGEGLTEAEIVRWHVKPGDEVKVNQIVVDIETAKSIVELPIPWDGVVAGLLADEGRTVDVGTPIIAVETSEPGGEPVSPAEETAARVEDLVPNPPAEGAVEPGAYGSPAPKEERQSVLVGYGVKTGATRRRPRKEAARGIPATPVANPSRVEVATPPPAPPRPSVLAKPPVRKLAKDMGVDLSSVTGTGPSGSITRDDVHAAAQRGTAAPRTTVPRSEGEERVPVKGVRKMTATAMVTSAFTAPHVTEFLQVDMTETMEAVRRLRQLPEFAEVKVSPLLLVARAVLIAARRHPMINSEWDEKNPEIVVKHYVNLGIAAATPRGLVVPNIKDAHLLSLPELAQALAELTETARAGRTQPAEMAGGTITITNVGVFGVDGGTPIINPGEAAILAFGQIRDMPWVVDGELAVRKVATLSLSFDHRIVDGDLGSFFLRDVGAMLEDPLRMIAWS